MSAKKITRKPRLTEAEYAEMAADYAAHPLTTDDVPGPIESTGTIMRMGRPTKISGRGGKTPSTTVRLPQDIREELARRAERDGASASEIVRRALAEHFALHPAG